LGIHVKLAIVATYIVCPLHLLHESSLEKKRAPEADSGSDK